MKRLLRWSLGLTLLLMLLAVAGGAWLLQELATLPSINLHVDGEDLVLQGGLLPGGGLLFGLTVAALALFVVLPLTLLLGLSLPLLIVGGLLGLALLGLVGLGSLLCSPLLLLALLAWWLLRERDGRDAARGKHPSGNA